jgi:THO complex subunit 2
MHVVHKTRGFLSNWEKSGEAEWYANPFFRFSLSNTPFLSRKYLTQLHSTPTDSNAADALVTTYHTLLSATLSLWPSEHPLSPPAFTAFVKSMLLSLPSSSQVASSPAATAFGELLIDTMWSIDSQLDDVIADSKATIVAQPEKEKESEQTNGQSEESGVLLSRDAAMKDKGTLLELVKLLLVR